MTDVPAAHGPAESQAIAALARPLDGWIVPPDTAAQRKRGRGSGRGTETMAQQLTELGGQLCNFQRKQRGKSARGGHTYRRSSEHFLLLGASRHGRRPP